MATAELERRVVRYSRTATWLLFRTIKPAPYPVHTQPAHIHLMVQEPGRPVYWIDEVIFEGEYLVTEDYKRTRGLRGGSGVVRLRQSAKGEWLANRPIYLEEHPARGRFDDERSSKAN